MKRKVPFHPNYYVDYIIIQTEKYRKYFDANLPEKIFYHLNLLNLVNFLKKGNACFNALLTEMVPAWCGGRIRFCNLLLNLCVQTISQFMMLLKKYYLESDLAFMMTHRRSPIRLRYVMLI